MSSINLAMILGRLTHDVDVRYTASGQPVANFSVATNEVWNDKQGQKQERVEFHRVVVWGKTAEHCGTYLRKGSQVHVSGRIQTNEWEKDGEKRYTTEIVADRVTFLDKPKDQGGR